MFLRNEKTDPKQQALDNVLMMLVHKRMTAPAREPKKMSPSYPPARDGRTNFEPDFDPKPVSRKGGAANPAIMRALQTYMNGKDHNTPTNAFSPQPAPEGMFNPNTPLDTSQVQDMRGQPNPLDILRMLAQRGAMAGDGRLGRPAPGGYR